MKTRVSYNGIEGIYETDDDMEALESFWAEHPELTNEQRSECMVTEVGGFFDQNRYDPYQFEA